MTREEAIAALRGLSGKMDSYATLLVRKGVAIESGQELVLQTPVESADFARKVVRAAYDAGAGHVTVIWTDDAITRMDYENVSLDYFQHTPAWKRAQLDDLAEAGAAFLFLEGRDPSMMKDVDPAKPAAAARARNVECKAFRDGLDFGHNAWCIAGAPVKSWARQVFPGMNEDEALYRLWEAVLSAARANGEDPQGDWERHNANFERNKRLMNSFAFDRLRYTSSNGTDLVVGMNVGHIWEGGAGRTQGGTVFFPNIPTEEVFCTPDRNRVNGIVHSALPLVHAGRIVENFWFRFSDGVVTDFGAEKGIDVLEHILKTDDNARRLGEVALISKNTPIRESGILFYDTLFDENASCHLALGMGFPECIEGGFEMTKDELIESGVNQSATHVDFMIGTDDLNVTGITPDGEEVQVFVNGHWAWGE